MTITGKNISGWWWGTSWVFACVMFVLVVIAVIYWNSGNVAWRSLFLGFSLLLLASVVLSIIDTDYGMWRAIIGADKRVSTSQLQTFLWTLLVAFVLAYFAGRTWFDGRTHLFDGFLPGESAKNSPIWDDYLILLGGPFAALVAAKGIITAKVQQGVVQKSTADDGAASIRQVVTNDAGNVDLVDTQYLIFNIVALAFVISGLATKDQLPVIPSLLLALTGSSAAAYVLNKSVQNNAPTITSIMPSSARPGEPIVIAGTNFKPAGVVGPPTVSIGGKQAIVEASATGSRLVARVPVGATPGVQDLVVTSAIRVSTSAATVMVLEDKPVILQVRPSAPEVGKDVTIEGAGFTSSVDASREVGVLFGTIPANGRVTGLSNGVEQVTVQVPGAVPKNTNVEVKIRTSRLTISDPVTLNFA